MLRPMVVVYRLSPLTYRLGKPFVRVDTYAMANLVAVAAVLGARITIDRAVRAIAQPQDIFEANKNTLRRLGRDGWDALHIGPSA